MSPDQNASGCYWMDLKPIRAMKRLTATNQSTETFDFAKAQQHYEFNANISRLTCKFIVPEGDVQSH